MPRSITPRAKAYARRAAEAQFDCAVVIRRKATPVFDDQSGTYSPVSTLVYEGKARIYSVDEAGLTPLGEGMYAMRSTFASIPWDTDPVPHNDDTLEVVGSPGDADLVGRSFRIVGVDGGGQMRATRRLHLTGLVENVYFDG